MMRMSLVVLIACLGCDAGLDDTSGPSGHDVEVDAGLPQVDNPPSPDKCPSGRVIYLNFDSAVLMDGASDAPLNRASWIVNGTLNPIAPVSARSPADRLTIINGVKAQVAAFPITVVTARPPGGLYVMVLYGGVASNVGSYYSDAAQTLDCGDVRKNDVAWIADAEPVQMAINDTIGAIGFGMGLTGTTDPSDCMCGWANSCVRDDSTACTLSPEIIRDPAAFQSCPGLTTQRELAAFATGFCQ